MSLSTELAEAIITLRDAEAEVESIVSSIKQIRHDHATVLAGLEELLALAQDDLDAAQEEAVKAAAIFAGDMAVERTQNRKKAS
jgi:hypothetical protein